MTLKKSEVDFFFFKEKGKARVKLRNKVIQNGSQQDLTHL